MKREIKLSYLLIISLCLVFTFSIGIKAVYNTALVEIREEFNLTMMQTQIGSFIYYGVYAFSQILFALLLKKINVKNIFFLSIITSCICYCCMIFADKAWKLWLLMGINGVLQAPHWSGCIYFIARFIRGKYVARARSIMSVSNPLGMALASGVVALFVFLSQWKLSFVMLGVLMIASAFLFKYSESQLERLVEQEETQKTTASAPRKSLVSPTKRQKRAFIITLLAVVFMEIVLSGGYTILKQTMSIFLFDMHGTDKALSVLLSVFLPVVAMCFQLLFFNIYNKTKNFLAISLCAIGSATLITVLLLFVFQTQVILSTVLFIFSYTAAICSASMLGGSVFSLETKDKMDAGSSSAILNAGAAAGCAAVPLGSGALLDIGGAISWSYMFLYVLGLFVVTSIVLVVLMLTKKKNYTFDKTNEQTEE